MSLGASAAGLAYGAVELHVISFETEHVPEGLLRALSERAAHGDVRILDLVLLDRPAEGAPRIRELEAGDDGCTHFALHARGLIAEDDLHELASCVPRGGAAAVVALEPIWAREFAEQIAIAGSVIVATVRIPAPAINAAVEIALED
ncbi:DUF6325 family protein [Leucobacter triazinivorans]|uniref:DUF1269 domain-containing protein n=1 Tax=Leucobacter triazinivorans TaxID=1784719 RepID=A0A4P6KG42_9MICO|nr:DUF6325 family protein [Leucobacter triazinivorans]QBE48938.1 hypothetical protein EVS81_08890 [Leucobacter triazinivorans]